MELIYDAAALKDLRALPKVDAKRIIEALEQVRDRHPQRQSFVTELQGMQGYWRARKGKYRAIYRQTETTIEVVAVNIRGEIYK